MLIIETLWGPVCAVHVLNAPLQIVSSVLFVLLTLPQVKQVWREAPIEAGQLDYLKFVHIMKRGADDE